MRGFSIFDFRFSIPGRGRRRSRALACLGAAIAALVLGSTVAQADGEAGLVIEHGDGTVETFCVAFTGSSIAGEELLRRAGVPVEQFSGLVCAIGSNQDEGCRGASSFESCTCKCSGANCTYWAFFTQPYGKTWMYSSLGFQAQRAKDGDVHGWKWGKGGPSSAPPPSGTTFEQICGHSPRGGAPPPTSAVAASTTVAPPTAAIEATTEPMTAFPATATVEPPEPKVTITAAAAAAVMADAEQRPKDDSNGVVPFLAVAGGLVVAIVGTVAWRRWHGA